MNTTVQLNSLDDKMIRQLSRQVIGNLKKIWNQFLYVNKMFF